MDQSDRIFIENRQHSKHHLNFFLRNRPYRGEFPTVAGFLLYPDTPTKMETTSRDAFRFKAVMPRDSGKCPDSILGVQNLHQETHSSHPVCLRSGKSADLNEVQPEDFCGPKMLSQYQQDFPPPSSWRRRRTPALPQPDNIAINPAFRIDFETVHRKMYPNWPNPEMPMQFNH
ncbi:uncharacterized protein LOC144212960 [Stigmatopora nigra]